MKSFTFIKNIIIFFTLFLSSFILYAQQQQAYITKTVITYLDGSSVYGAGVDDFGIDLVTAPNVYAAAVSKINKDTITIMCSVEGEYQIYFYGLPVTRFTVSKQKNKLVSDLPLKVALPFNYIIKADTIRKIYIYDESGNKIDEVTTNQQGYYPVTKTSDFVSTHFFVCFFKDGFPIVRIFYEQQSRYKNQINRRKIRFSPPYGSLKSATYKNLGNNTVHNIDDDIFYRLLPLTFNTDNNQSRTYLWLLIYNAAINRASVHLADLPDGRSELFLDENGKAVLLNEFKDNSTGKSNFNAYFIDKNGSLKPAHDVPAPPLYGFNGNIVSGSRWQIPVFLGKPLTQGKHTVVASCVSKNGRTLSSSVSFDVFYSPDKKRFLYRNADGSVSIYPAYLDPDVQFNTLSDIRNCYLKIDNEKKVEFSHTGEAAKGIFYSDMTDEEKQKAYENVSPEFGWEDAEPYDYGIDLFAGSKYYRVGDLINKKIGPYDNLKYSVTEITGEYQSPDEARKYCRNPKPHRYLRDIVYRCFKDNVVSVCLENFRYKSTDKGKVIDFDALFCGEGLEENKKGDQIVYKVTAEGYAAFSGALIKRSLQASEFTLTGKILNEDSIPVKEAKIGFKGVDGFVLSDSAGSFTIKRAGDGRKPYSENITLILKKTGVEVFCEELGTSVKDTFGIVSDGFTTLKLKVKARGVDSRTVLVKQPDLGEFTVHSMLNLALVIDDDGNGTMEYVPPLYLKNERLNSHIPLKSDSVNKILSPKLWVADVPVTITYEDEEGTPGEYTFLIRVTRPPVMLVHGFTGNEQTWEKFANYLRTQKYEPVVREYYKGAADESTIERQSEKLGKYIREVHDAYFKSHFLQNRVDIVAHSMGGLISRYYISNMAKYGKKAGIYIPYNVKLSRDQLRAERFKTPVILNDVRKLIMVGTPNHGASWIDERLGYWAARNEKYHQIASAQLRNDSPFFKTLNKGESEGRHLDANVQYAILYGVRKRSPFYLPDSWFHTWGTSQKEFAGDDGVVTISSAKLNGVKEFPFPKEWFAKHGYIHSPAIQDFFPEDEPITESENVFEKITELLQEDIPRMPLKNSFAKIIRAQGIVKYRYFSTQNWVPVKTPVEAGNTKRLANNWCRVKTEDGSATLGFFLNGHQWGMLHIMPNTIAYYEYASPEFVNIYMQQGKARFISRKKDGGGFEIVLGEKGEQWYAFNPKAKVKDLNTDFTVETDKGNAVVQSIYGFVAVGKADKGAKKVKEESVGRMQGLRVTNDGGLNAFKVPAKGWWSAIDTTFLPDDTTSVLFDTALSKINLGELSLTASGKYLPPGGFVTLNLHIDSLPDTLLIASLTIKDGDKCNFINISNSDEKIDSDGNALFNVTINEPSGDNVMPLSSVPLQVTFKVVIVMAGSKQVISEKELTIPVGMILFTGKTTGPDFRPRNEISAPDLFPVTYQILNQTNTEGDFYILFNYALYQKELKKKQQYAKRTGSNFDKKSLNLTIKWPGNCSIPLKYKLPDSVLHALKPGVKIVLGAQGNFDLLTAEEHQRRIIKYVEEFASDIPIDNESKTYLFTKLDKLRFNYDAKNVTVPSFSDNLNYEPVINIPVSKQEFWGENYNRAGEPAYSLVFHVMGHFLHQVLVLHNHRYYNFLAEKCGGSSNICILQTDPLKYLFDKAEYISFNEAGADFFVILLYDFLKKTNSDFFEKSIYSHKGYVVDFMDFDKFKKVQNKYPAYLVSGPQTAFLADYYGDSCVSGPVWVYHDFILNMLSFVELTRGADPASVMGQWILSKHIAFENKKPSVSRDPNILAEQYGLFGEKENIQIIPRTDFSRAKLIIDNTIVSGFNQIPAVTVSGESQIGFGKGNFVALVPSKDTIMMIEADSASIIRMKNGNRLLLLTGTFFIDAPIEFKTKLADFHPAGNNITLSISPKQTMVYNNTGSLKIVTEKNEVIVPAGFSTIISKKGKIKKPKLLKKKVPERFDYVSSQQ